MTTSLKDSVAKGLALAAWIPLKEEGTAIAPEFSLIRKEGDFILTGKFGRDHLFPELIHQLEASHDETLTVPELSNLLTGLKDDVTASLDNNQNDDSSGLNGLTSYVDSFKSCFSLMVNIHFNEVEFSARFGEETNPLTGNIEKTTSVMFALETEWLAIQIYFKKSVVKINGINHGSSKVLLLAKPINEVELRDIVPLTDPSVLPDFSLDACFVCSSVPLNGDEVSALMVLKPGANAAQPLFSGLTNNTLVNSLPAKKLNVGVALLANIKLNDTYAPLYIPLNPDKKTETPASGLTEAEQKVIDEQQTTPLKAGQSGAITGKKLGPITVSSVSLTYDDPNIKLSVDGTLSMASFQLILDALVLKVDLNEIFAGNIVDALSFDLAGLSLFINTSSFSLAGSLFRIEGEYADEYLGRLSLSTKTLSLGALGAYTKLPSGQTSMFAYLAINYPIGGIPAFFVEGLALGFGYNRAIKLPGINKVHQFPLVTSLNGKSVGGSVDADSIVEVKAQLKALSAD
ncbi:MAG: hypothetical protein HRU20_28875, partial [Pseudomonadales bacterium]|nr:hypothetical protein [Pseudomonadales bacterium]